MTPEQQRIAIAEACGWKEIRAEVDWLPEELTGIFTWPHPTDAEKTKYFINRKPVPNYLYDLNAMHEAENVLFPVEVDDLYGSDLVKEYGDILQHLCCGNPGGVMRATASQRAEAFLRTIGKWEESK